MIPQRLDSVQDFTLMKHFLRGFLEGDWLAGDGQWQRLAVSAASIAIPAGLLLTDGRYLHRYLVLSSLPNPEPYRAALVADKLSLLTLSMAITMIVSGALWQQLFPGKRDHTALGFLPVRPAQVFRAKLAALLVFSSAFIFVLNAFPSLMFAAVTSSRWQANTSYATNVLGFFVSSGLGCAFGLLGAVALQGVLLNLVTARLFARLTVYFQAVLLAGGLLAAVFSLTVSNLRFGPEKLRSIAAWAPPAWFLGLNLRLVGEGQSNLASGLAAKALESLAIVASLAICSYLTCYRRQRIVWAEPIATGVFDLPLQHLDAGRLASDPRRTAVTAFLVQTILRSRFHRLCVLSYIGFGLAIIANVVIFSFVHTWSTYRVVLSLPVCGFPLILTAFTLGGLRHAFSVPAELGANWLFRLAAGLQAEEYVSTVERVVLRAAILPIQALCFAVSVVFLGWTAGCMALILNVFAAALLFELIFHDWQKIPFTCSYLPGRHLLLQLVLYSTGMLMGAPMLSALFYLSLSRPTWYALILAILIATWGIARWNRMRSLHDEVLLFEDSYEGPLDLIRVIPG